MQYRRNFKRIFNFDHNEHISFPYPVNLWLLHQTVATMPTSPKEHYQPPGTCLSPGSVHILVRSALLGREENLWSEMMWIGMHYTAPTYLYLCPRIQTKISRVELCNEDDQNPGKKRVPRDHLFSIALSLEACRASNHLSTFIQRKLKYRILYPSFELAAGSNALGGPRPERSLNNLAYRGTQHFICLGLNQ